MSTKIQFRRGTASQWTSANPILSSGETGYETDTGKLKIGNGSTAWSSLDYFLDTSELASTYLTQASASTTYAIKETFTSLDNGATAMALANNETVIVTPTATATYTTTSAAAGSVARLIILTSGTSSYTITFGSGFKTTGICTTGTVSARYFVFNFVSDGTNWIEMSRTVAIA